MISSSHMTSRWARGADAADLERLIDALYRVQGLLGRVTELDALLETVISESQMLADAEASSLLLYDAAADDLYFHLAQADAGDADALRRSLRLKLGEGIAGKVALSQETIHVSDAANDPRVFRGADAITRFETRSILAVPMAKDGRLVGVLEVLNKRSGGPFTDYDLRVVEMFGGLAAVAITRARLIEEHLRDAQLAAVGRAVAGLSHHTRNILTGLNGSLELVDNGLQTNELGLVREAWPVLKRSAGRLERVVMDMLAYSKPREPVFEACDLREVIQQALSEFGPHAAQRRIEVTSDLSRLAVQVRCEASSLHHALLNLFSNAEDAVAAGRGKIHIEAGQDSAGATEISVEDNGPGVDPADRGRIFQPFYSSKGGKGTGLGLAVTAKIVAEHGGSVCVDQGRLGGARFRILLPGNGRTGRR